jgi:hypothetical protein
MIRLPQRLAASVLVLSLSACLQVAAPTDSLDAAARDYVRLQLAIGQKEDGYIDAYYGPAELAAQGKAEGAAETLAQLQTRVGALQARIAALSSAEPRRAAFLGAQLTAARTRLRMLSGEKLSFQDEAQGLFGVRPELKPLPSFEPVLARIATLVPGKGRLADRVEAFRDRFVIPPKRLEGVMRAAIAECKARTVSHIALPPGERFELGFVRGKSWSGYNYYLGDYASRIEVNLDLPIRIERAVDLGCHEGYPGHHVLNALLEQKLVHGRGWTEFSVYPLFSPQSLIAEGSANYGYDLAFPGEQRLAFETGTLYPLARLKTGGAPAYEALQLAMRDLAGARFTIAADFLDGRVDEAQTLLRLQHYQLISEPRARQSLAFIKQYRSYVINYGLGRDMIAADVESAGRDPVARWARMEQLLSQPTLPSDLRH